jgi:hypothetical protein
VAEIDKKTGAILSEAPQQGIDQKPGLNFAFAFWGGDFYMFVGPYGQTGVYRYSPNTSATTLVKTVSLSIVGASTSTCAPTAPPH